MEPIVADDSNHLLPLTPAKRSVYLLQDLLTALRGQTGVLPSYSCTKVIEFVVDRYPEKEFAKFPGVSPQEYQQLRDFFDDCTSSNIPRPRIRLSYLHRESTVFVEMPTYIHEVPFNILGGTLRDFTRTLPGVSERFSFTLHTNSAILGKDSNAVPDLALSITDLHTNHIKARDVLTLFIGECAFSQPREAVLQKLNAEINSAPEVIMVILIEIHEHNPYQSPAYLSSTSQQLLSTPLQGPSEFISSRDPPWTIDQPVKIAGHIWFDLASIKFTVCTRDSVASDSEPINVYNANTSAAAFGTLFPSHLRDMDDVNSAIQSGLGLFRDRVMAVAGLDPGGHASGSNASSPMNLDRTWDNLTIDLLPAVELTAFSRYKDWYQKWSTQLPLGDDPLPPPQVPGSTYVPDCHTPAGNIRSRTLQRRPASALP